MTNKEKFLNAIKKNLNINNNHIQIADSEMIIIYDEKIEESDILINEGFVSLEYYIDNTLDKYEEHFNFYDYDRNINDNMLIIYF